MRSTSSSGYSKRAGTESPQAPRASARRRRRTSAPAAAGEVAQARDVLGRQRRGLGPAHQRVDEGGRDGPLGGGALGAGGEGGRLDGAAADLDGDLARDRHAGDRALL